jgi:hypothetical protein
MSQKYQMGMQKEGAMVNLHLGPTLVPWSFSVRENSQLFIFTGEFLSKSIFNLALSLLSKGILKKKKIKSPKFHIYCLMFDGRPHSSCSGAPGARSSRSLILFDITPTLPNDFPSWRHIYEWLRLTNCFHFWKEAQKQGDFVDNCIVSVGKLEGKVRFSVESTRHCKSQKHQMGMQKEGSRVNPHLGPTLVPWSFSVRDHSQLFIFTGEFLSKAFLI